jgi:choline dehydrogenase-like flavoprotein
LTEPVIIVGSGPAGVSAAWPLLEAGVPVLMIDAAPLVPFPAPPRGDITAFRGDPNRWTVQFGADLGGLAAMGNLSPKLATPLGRAVLGGYAESIGVSTKDFLVLGSLAVGGLSNIWGAVAAVYDDADLRGFPFRYAELQPSYEAVMRRIGVSGFEDHARAPASQGPRLTPPLQRILDTARSRSLPAGLELAPSTNAILMEDRDGRAACANCGLCLWGCHRGSIYASRQEIPALRGFPHFTYRPGVSARRLLPASPRPAIEVAQDGVLGIMTGQRILLACGAIATTALVLRYLGADASPVRLMTNPVAAMAFLVPSLVGAALPSKSFSLAQLAYRLALADGHHAAGILYGVDALPLTAIADWMPVSRPVALRLGRALAPALVLATCYLPGSFSANTMRLAGEGEPAPVLIEGSRTAAADAALRQAGRALGRMLRRFGAYALPGSLAFAPPGADGHYAATLPMGGAGPMGTDLCGEIRWLPGVHAVDSAVLSELPAKHCTLTIMANADRIARRLVSEARVNAKRPSHRYSPSP